MNSDTNTQHPPDRAVPPILCPHCGLDRNSRGQPFKESTLEQHILKMHPDMRETDKEAKPDNAMSCGICGSWKSRRGIPFLSESDLARHRAVAHRNGDTVSHESQSSNGATVQPRQKSRQVVAVAPVKFCPQCGCNMEVIAAALSFMQ